LLLNYARAVLVSLNGAGHVRFGSLPQRRVFHTEIKPAVIAIILQGSVIPANG
jgi:hypothetical protein